MLKVIIQVLRKNNTLIYGLMITIYNICMND